MYKGVHWSHSIITLKKDSKATLNHVRKNEWWQKNYPYDKNFSLSIFHYLLYTDYLKYRILSDFFCIPLFFLIILKLKFFKAKFSNFWILGLLANRIL